MIEKLNYSNDWSKQRFERIDDKINEIIDWINSIDPVHYIVKSPESTGKSEVDLSVSQDARKGCGKKGLYWDCGDNEVLCDDCKVKGAIN